jgi:arylsulfatase A
LNRRDFLGKILKGGTIATLSGLSFCSSNENQNRPNFIIFLADDLGYGDLACYGHPFIKSPNIDRFASEGMKFTDFHSGGTVCSPSRASLLTGRNPYRSGFYYIVGGGAHLKKEEITIAKILQENGYDTCFVGKWHLSRFGQNNNQPTPGDHGFDHWFATAVNAFEGPQNPQKFYRNGTKVGEVNGWYCDVIVDEAIQWMKKRKNPHKPFFLLVCSHEPHTPISPPDTFAEMYESEEINQLEKTINYGQVERSQKDLSSLKKYYYGTVTQLDKAFGKLVQTIDTISDKNNTVVFFTSDNGPESPVSLDESKGEWEDPIRDRCFGTPGLYRGMKRFPYEGGHRVPGIVRWPDKIKSGTTNNEFINGTDFLPTLCELAKASIPTDRIIDGTSMVPAFNDNSITRKIPACWFFPAYEDAYSRMPNMAIRENNYILTGWFEHKNTDQTYMDWLKSTRLKKYELFDLETDATQVKNIIQTEPEQFQKMKLKMKKLWLEIQQDGPYWENWNRK